MCSLLFCFYVPTLVLVFAMLQAHNACSDLFWALRGAGHNDFGVVTSFRLALFVGPPRVTVFHIRWPIYQAALVLDVWQRWHFDSVRCSLPSVFCCSVNGLFSMSRSVVQDERITTNLLYVLSNVTHPVSNSASFGVFACCFCFLFCFLI